MGTIVQTKEGKLLGVREGDCFVFKGIPYAKPPVGELRFRRAVPYPAWEGMKDATHFGCRCYQDLPEGFIAREFYPPEWVPPESEDCLTLNVWTRNTNPDRLMPVALWIHGGAYMNGFGGEMEFDGAGFCKRGVVLVTINYRLGVFGYFAHEALQRRDGETGNYAVTDQLTALKWVAENITAFGGDPGAITVMGQSSGAKSVQTLVSSPCAKGLLRGAILQSGGGWNPENIGDRSLAEGMSLGEDFLRYNRCDLDDLAICPAPVVREWNTRYYRYSMAQGVLPYQPLFGTDILPKPYGAAAEAGACLPIPYLIGCVLHDIEPPYRKPDKLNDSAYFRGILKWCALQTEHSGKQNYAYLFSRSLPGDDAGTFHCGELWYMFGTLKRCWRPMTSEDVALSEQMMDAWANFIHVGDPNGQRRGNWRPCTQCDPYYHILDAGLSGPDE